MTIQVHLPDLFSKHWRSPTSFCFAVRKLLCTFGKVLKMFPPICSHLHQFHGQGINTYENSCVYMILAKGDCI